MGSGDRFGITKTIPAGRVDETLETLYGGQRGEYEFHMAGTPSRLTPGHFVYTIAGNEVVGRLRILRIEGGAVHPNSGRPRSLIYVETPGEKAPIPYARPGHRGTRYYDGEGWPG